MTKQETYEYLTAHGVEYEVIEHPAVFNMAEAAGIHLPHPEADAKNLFVRDDKKLHYYMITVQGDKRVDLKKFRGSLRIHIPFIHHWGSGRPWQARLPKFHDKDSAYPARCASSRKRHRRS